MSLCRECSFFYQLSNKEKRIIGGVLGSGGVKFQLCEGVCIGSKGNPQFLVQKIIMGEVVDCSSFAAGPYKDSLGIVCPLCKNGYLIINRQINIYSSAAIVFFNCSNFPECQYVAHEVELKTSCRFCGHNLILTGGDILHVKCPYCKKPPVLLPITPRIYPAVIFPAGECSHTQKMPSCFTCETSRSTRKNLLELERTWLLSLLPSSDSKFYISKSGTVWSTREEALED